MPVETVFTTMPVKEPPSPRRRPAETGAAGDDKGFSLPQQGEAAASTAPERGQGATGKGKPQATDRQQSAAEAAKSTVKTAGQDKAATGAAAEALPAQSGSFIEALAELVAAAQEQATPSEGTITNAEGAKDKAGKKGGDGEKTNAASKDKAEGVDAALTDKIPAETVAAATAFDQKPATQPMAAMISLSLPAAAGEEKAGADAGTNGGAISGDASPKVRARLEAAHAVRVGVAGQSEEPVDKSAADSAEAPAGFAVPGGHSATAGQTHKAADSGAAADAATSTINTDAAQDASPGAGVAVASAELKAADAVRQALAPIDLGALVQQAVGSADSARLLSPLDQAAANAAPTPAPGQGQAALPPTPLHVLPIEIGLRALSGSKQFDIRLDPDELGRVDVSLSISDKGEVSARLVVDRVETLHLLQRDARTLERAFEQAGLKPSDGGVDISLRDPSDQSAFRQQRQHEEAPQRSRQPSAAEIGDDTVLPSTPAPQRRIVRLGGVDLSI